MNTVKKALSLALAAIFILSALPVLSVGTFAETDIPDRILFSSSFEKSDPEVPDSVSDDGYYSNVSTLEVKSDMPGEFTAAVDLSSIKGSSDYVSNESKRMLFDMQASTKFLTGSGASKSSPVTVSFAFDGAYAASVYSMTSANDETSRDPKSWTLYGSVDGGEYNVIDSRSNQSFSSRGQTVTYQIAEPTEYQYYRLEITENHGAGMTQLADIRLATGEDIEAERGDSPMTTRVGGGPASPWGAGGAFDGSKTLAVSGKQDKKTDTYARNVVYTGLDIAVTKNTRFSYVHFPAVASGDYDYEYTSMHMMLDVKFTDGTYLSSLGAYNSDGFPMEPDALGESDSLFTNQWCYIETNLGDCAEGKTIEGIYVYFRMENTGTASKFLAYFDDIVIEDRADIVYGHLSDYINPLRGTNNTTAFSRGLTAPFCDVPNGFNFYTPVTNPGSNMPYQYFDRTISQFSVSHVPSTWVGDYGTWQFMANTSLDAASASSSSIAPASLASSFDHDNETAKAYYYSVTFNDGTPASGVTVEMAPTSHALYVRFTFPADSDNVNIVFDCYRAGGKLQYKDDGTFTATSNHTNNNSPYMQVYGEFSTVPEYTKVINTKSGIASFPKGTTEVTLKLATSYLTSSQAKHSLELEIPEGKSFDDVKASAQSAWDEKCSMIEVEGASYDQLVTLYSCIYRMYSYPNLYSENAGTNETPEWVYASPYKNGVKTSGKMYVNNGFWDTYRTTWAGYALLTPTLDGEMLDGLIEHYKANGWIPRWIAPGGADSMLGTSSDIIFADAYVKGIDFDCESAYASMLRNALTVSSDIRNGGRAENETAVFTGYVSNSTNNGFSWTMEDYISDYCIGVMSEKLGHTAEAEYFYNRAACYVNMYNKKFGFFMGKNSAGSWSSDSSYNASSWWGDYAEASGWTMAFTSVYDGNGLANLLGGKAELAKKLDSYFDNSVTAMKKVATGTIHEMVEAREVRLGQYSHSNQPAHAMR